MQQELRKLFVKEMTRKQFLLLILSTIYVSTGMGTLLKSLNSEASKDSGFGGGPYGGYKK